ncbi:hypothetical protein CE91St52_05460 [Phascolarctobacterium faecium]|uniref:hypothetical protein n=1 Tax=Phascolarctobacterium faecium TaxID=33025 RepID=UPI001FCB9811|nr:hypothetical protein [Phascolarctobacterium faecium]BDE83769.1 hypothetical protein CE91St52_05460 [Phascolarctobacterium faecium]BDE92894.1 hypothetical protein CE91St53_05460 [Phascolarctobacterium faecium]
MTVQEIAKDFVVALISAGKIASESQAVQSYLDIKNMLSASHKVDTITPDNNKTSYDPFKDI